MKILNVNSTLGLKKGGGTAERTYQMSRYLSKKGHDVTILTLSIDLDFDRINGVSPAKVITIPCLCERFFFPFGGWIKVFSQVEASDVTHLMGHWSILNAIAYIALRIKKKPYVVCPAGALLIFGRSSLFKNLYNLIIGNSIIKNASGWIAVTKNEFSDFEGYGIRSSQVSVIPNGVSTEDLSVCSREHFLTKFSLPDMPYLLFMGRLNLIKGPDLLLEAFISISNKFPNYHLVFAGPDGGMLDQLRSLAEHCQLHGRVHFIGHLSGIDKSSAYYHSELLIVPSRREAMSIVAIEAGLFAKPVIVTNQCGFEEINIIDEALEVTVNAEAIANSLTSVLSDYGKLIKLGKSFQELVNKNYEWGYIAKLYLNLYEKILIEK